jgi:hypothetical protein
VRRFYVEYLGCKVDWQEGAEGGPAYIQVSRGPLTLNLSSHHGDGTPGGVVLVYVDNLYALHQELHSRDYPFLNPGIEPHGAGRETVLLDPASNQIRFFKRPRPT